MAKTQKSNSSGIENLVRVGFFLAVRQVKRSNIWTNVLIVSIMTLTFLNLVIVSGILVGLIEGAVTAVKSHYLGDIFISNLKNKSYIEQSSQIIKAAQNLPSVEAVAARYIETGKVESDYKENKKRVTDLDESVGTSIVGIDPKAEDIVTGLSGLVIEGDYLEENDYDRVLVGAMLLKKYLDFDSPTFPVLQKVEIGDKIQVTIGENVREVIVKGITRSKVDEIDRRIFFVDKQLRGLIGRNDYNVDEIVLRLAPKTDPISVKNALIGNGFDQFARIQTQEDAEPKFIKDMKQTFALLGNIISSIGLVVAAITIFIVIFVNAITRRKFIGILKGIGIHPKAIEMAYVFQSVFYALMGTAIGTFLVFGVIKPYLDKNPINFPFSDGILVATASGTAIRIAVLLIATFIAGLIPARMVVKQNTLDSILGR
ncbi:MAG: ABC-type transport system permease component LolE [Parcubacteria group bacterium Gr01-1014_20]|nr:MAG: ABC-type transport system permease component LolE [Parcubacteria group bacterium Gr01-1014_20]